MHVLVLFVLSLLIANSATGQNASEPSRYTLRVAVERLNVRPKMSTRFNEMTQAERGDELYAVDKIRDWHRILPPPNTFCYVLADNIELLSSVRGVVRDSVGSLPVRLGSNTSPTSPDTAEILAELTAGDQVEIVIRDGDWYRIRPPAGVFAYVMDGDASGKFVEVISGTPVEGFEDEPVRPVRRDPPVRKLPPAPLREELPALEQPPIRIVENAPPIQQPQDEEEWEAPVVREREETYRPIPQQEAPRVTFKEPVRELPTETETPRESTRDEPRIVDLAPVAPVAPMSGAELAQREMQVAARILPPRSANNSNSSSGIYDMEPVRMESSSWVPPRTSYDDEDRDVEDDGSDDEDMTSSAMSQSSVAVSRPLEIQPFQPADETQQRNYTNTNADMTSTTTDTTHSVTAASSAQYPADWMERFMQIERALPLELQKDALARDWKGFLAQLRPIATQTESPEAARVAQIRVRNLEKRIADQDFVRRAEAAVRTNSTYAVRNAYQTQQVNQPALVSDVGSFFDARGVLVTEPTPKELERLRRPRLIDPATGAVTAYIDTAGLDFRIYENKMVGARGTIWYDTELGGRIIRVDHYQVLGNDTRITSR